MKKQTGNFQAANVQKPVDLAVKFSVWKFVSGFGFRVLDFPSSVVHHSPATTN
jgi:hypothetical protein